MSEKEQSVVNNNNKRPKKIGFTPEERSKAADGRTLGKLKRQARFLEALDRVGYITKACEEVGISLNTPYLWAEKEGKFAEKLEALKTRIISRRIDVIEDRFVEVAQSATQPQHFTAGLAFLNAHHPSYNRQRMEVSGPGGGPIVHAHAVAVKGMSDEELQAFLVKHLPKALPQARQKSEENEG